MKIEIRNRYTNEIMHVVEADTIKLALEILTGKLADLHGADLSGANLSWVNLSWANFHGADLSVANLRGAKNERLRQAIQESDDTDGPPVGWTIEAIGKDGSIRCRSPGGQVRRYNFCEFNLEGTK